MSTDVLGIVAGLLTASSTFPQLVKTYRSKDASEISVLMFTVLIAGLILWIIYGFRRSDLPIIVMNILAVCLNVIMLVFKFRYS